MKKNNITNIFEMHGWMIEGDGGMLCFFLEIFTDIVCWCLGGRRGTF